MKKLFSVLSILIIITLSSAISNPALAQAPTFGPTCTPSPTLPVTAGSPTSTPLALAIGTFFLLSGFGAHFLAANRKTK